MSGIEGSGTSGGPGEAGATGPAGPAGSAGATGPAGTLDPAATPINITGAWTFVPGLTIGNVTDNPVSTFLGTGVITMGGALVLPRVSVNGSTVPANGICSPSAGQLGLAANSAVRVNVQSTVCASSVPYSCSAAGSFTSPSYALTSGNGMYLFAGGVVGMTAASGVRLTLSATENTVFGNLVLANAGNGLQIKEGTNARSGVSTLVGGTVVVGNTSVTAVSRIKLSVQSLGTVAVPSGVGVSARTAGTNFTILASAPTDTSVIYWEIQEPAP